MKELSQTLIAMYEAAESVSLLAFPRAAVRALRPLVRFEGAFLATGEASESGNRTIAASAFLGMDGDEIVEQRSVFQDRDAVSSRFVERMSKPLRGECRNAPQTSGFASMNAFAARNGFQNLLLFGAACGNLRPLWLALFRSAALPFTANDGAMLETAWPHLERSMILNRSRHLERLVRRHDSRAAALVNRRGFIEAADQRFLEMLAIEWPATREGPLPPAVLARIHDGLPFEGARIRLVPYGQDEVIVCKAYERDRLSALTPAELAVARHFSRGLTHKDVAQRLGVSQNTVRTHIRHVYDKLAIHSKAHLVQLMSSGTG